MDQNLKARMLDAAVVADRLWQRNVAKALTDGLAEIERLGAVLVEIQQMQAPAVEKLKSILPLLHRLEHPTPEMREVMEGETPYFWRRCLEKTHYEVGYLDYPDWREAVAEPQVIVFTSKDGDEARDHCEQLQFEWRYSEMLRVAAEQPFTPTGEPS